MADCEILVIGGGAAGLTAALFAARCGHSTTVLLPDMPGGHLANIERIEDFPGFPDGVAGFDLGPNLQMQAEYAGADFRPTEASAIERAANDWLVTTGEAPLSAQAVILAMGARPKPLGLPGEDRLGGRGISHCASCDGPLLRGRPAVVAGGGDSAFLEALTLAELGSPVTIVHRSVAPKAMRVYRQRVDDAPNVTVQPQTIIHELVGGESLEAVRVRDAAGGEALLPTSGLFVYVGLEPNTQIVANLLQLDSAARIPTDVCLRTALPGLFAAGDVRSGFCGQAISAAGDGAAAALAAHRYLTDERQASPPR